MECLWSDPRHHPHCPHGPTLLFGIHRNDELQKFYTCSAYRDPKVCGFRMKEGQKFTSKEAAKWKKLEEQFTSKYHHRPLYIKFNKVMSIPPERRCYCYTCESLMSKDEEDKHQNHEIKEGLTDYEMRHPTEVLKPLTNPRQEAQYFFTEKAIEDIANMLLELDAKQVLCIGAPRIHEYILEKHEHTISSLLLDLDGRFNNFFGPLSFCWYNLLNNYFYNKEAFHVFKDFLMENNGKDTYIVCDPPFGCRTEPMSWTLKRITELHKSWNNIEDESDCLKIMFIFPYFMESILKEKSTPVDETGGLKTLKMTDYKVAYENHPLFVTESKGPKLSSIRIYTNIPLNLIKLPESDGYKYCKLCKRWVSPENKHCSKCKECTSKNGTTYKHCIICKRCVKPSWEHCKTCERCVLADHNCEQKPTITGKCYKCRKVGHIAKDCKRLQCLEPVLNTS